MKNNYDINVKKERKWLWEFSKRLIVGVSIFSLLVTIFVLFMIYKTQDMNYNKMVGLMTSLEITKTVKNDETTISIGNVSNELIYTYYKSYRNFKVIPFSQMNSTYLRNYKDIYERYKKVIQMYDEDMYVVPVAE